LGSGWRATSARGFFRDLGGNPTRVTRGLASEEVRAGETYKEHDGSAMADSQIWHHRSRGDSAGHGQRLQQLIKQQRTRVVVTVGFNSDVSVVFTVIFTVIVGVKRRLARQLAAERDAVHQRHVILAAVELQPARHG
jgi:hypothetical protein